MRRAHRMPYGAELGPRGARFRFWAPAARDARLRLQENGTTRELALEPDGSGWLEAEVQDVGAGARYGFALKDGLCVPDPASRFQPENVHGPSELIDPTSYAWGDREWRGRPWAEAVVYELHVGAFSAPGDYAGVAERLQHLVELGISALELMPLAECPGRWNWGYDGVLPFAPASRYGRPDALKRLVDLAHAHGLMVLLDVVYNHFGPEGNYLHAYAPDFFNERDSTPWGAALDFESPGAVARDFFLHNALYWLEEFHLDGLRIDAVHAIHDRRRPDFVEELAETVRARFGPERHVHLVLENDANTARYLKRDGQGRALLHDAQWNDDIHHALHVVVSGEQQGYYADYADDPLRHLGRCLAEGFAYQGEPSPHRGGGLRGEPSVGLPPTAFVSFLQNHDQVGNRAFGERIVSLADPRALRAACGVLLLAPSPPLLFMGEEWGCAQPFPFFCDFGPELAALVREGRRSEFASFPEFRDEASRARIPAPEAPDTFRSAVLDWDALQSESAQAWLQLYRELLALRRREIVPRLRGVSGRAGAWERFGAHGLGVRWRLGDGSELRLAANLAARRLEQAALAPSGRSLWTSEPGLLRALASGTLPAWSVAWWLA